MFPLIEWRTPYSKHEKGSSEGKLPSSCRSNNLKQVDQLSLFFTLWPAAWKQGMRQWRAPIPAWYFSDIKKGILERYKKTDPMYKKRLVMIFWESVAHLIATHWVGKLFIHHWWLDNYSLICEVSTIGVKLITPCWVAVTYAATGCVLSDLSTSSVNTPPYPQKCNTAQTKRI